MPVRRGGDLDDHDDRQPAGDRPGAREDVLHGDRIHRQSAFTDHNAACVVVEEGHSAFMLLVRDYFQTFSDRPIGDPAVTVSVATAIFVDSRETVDASVADGVAAGGSEAQPASDYGFMYQRQLTDPDGNIIEFGYMDPVAAALGPEAFVKQQA
jgi:uncharacterized protein